MTRLAAIDPGYAAKKGNAIAIFNGGRLVEVHTGDGPRGRVEIAPVDEVVIERPQQDGRSANVPPATLIKLAWAGALLAGYFAGRDGARIHEYTPAEWKGSEPKPVMHARLWAVLSAAEREVLGGAKTLAAIDAARVKGALKRWGISGGACYSKSFTTADALDATALGCVHLGRLRRVG